jgi:dethiobiotin synthetase
MLAQEDNIAFLRQKLDAPLLATIAWQAVPDPRAVTFNLPLNGNDDLVLAR